MAGEDTVRIQFQYTTLSDSRFRLFLTVRIDLPVILPRHVPLPAGSKKAQADLAQVLKGRPPVFSDHPS